MTSPGNEETSALANAWCELNEQKIFQLETHKQIRK